MGCSMITGDRVKFEFLSDNQYRMKYWSGLLDTSTIYFIDRDRFAENQDTLYYELLSSGEDVSMQASVSGTLNIDYLSDGDLITYGSFE